MTRANTSRVRTVPGILTMLLLTTAAEAVELSIDIAPLNGGLVGLKQADPVVRPHFLRQSDGSYKASDDLVVVRENHSFFWSPAISTGLIFRFAEDADKIALGLGAHFVAFRDTVETRTAPALTIHFGTRTRQVFFGGLFVASDEVTLPGGRSEVVVPKDEAQAFTSRRTSRRLNFFAGIIIPLGGGESEEKRPAPAPPNSNPDENESGTGSGKQKPSGRRAVDQGGETP
jgi:hypothetical protein